jgi:hypothetical protein
MSLLLAVGAAACGGDRPGAERASDSSTGAPVATTDGAVPLDAGDAKADTAASDPRLADGTPLTDASCGDRFGVLWDALEDAELGEPRLGYCLVSASGTTGALVFDASGRLTDVMATFRSDAPAKADWLAMFANDQFPCFAGQTVPYSCSAN